MPMSSWKSVAGLKCWVDKCNNVATHWYGMMAICCECHGGYIIPNEEAKMWHLLTLSQNAE